MRDTIAGGGMDRRTFLRTAGALGALLALPRAARAELMTPEGAARASAALRSGDGPVSLASLRPGDKLDVVSRSFDLTEHGHGGWVDAVLWPGDRARLRALGVEHRILVPDLVAMDLQHRAAEAQAAVDAGPSERMTYRTLLDYENDIAALAQDHADLVRRFELPFKTHDGRRVVGVEMSANVQASSTDGRPTAFIMGLHHAREWPSAELTMMFAEDLATSYAAGDTRVVALLDRVRVIIVPVVNPDGFVRSRELVSDFVVPAPGLAAASGEYPYHRKNTRPIPNSKVPYVFEGVDPNRNYPYRWGGVGASHQVTSEIYYGPGPGSEPEVANVMSVVLSNQVLTLATNHTYGNLVLRPWGERSKDAPDEQELRALGDAMAASNGYISQKGIDLYPTTGTTDDWFYAVCGGFGYTFEIGGRGATPVGPLPHEGAGFHPQYNLWVPRFYASNRDAFLKLAEAALDRRLHSVIAGTAPAGSEIVIEKTVATPLSYPLPDESLTMHETISSRHMVGDDGAFEIHVNPSPAPTTVDRVLDGKLPTSALESYTVIAKHPDGATRVATVMATRGNTYTLDLR